MELNERVVFPKLEEEELPSERALRGWNLACQRAFFEQRRAHWNRIGGNDAANACREVRFHSILMPF